MVRASIIGVAVVLVLVRTADAGVCVSPDEADEGMKEIEAFAKVKTKDGDQSYGWLCVELDAPRFKKRIERACRVILDRDGMKSPCATLAGAAGIAMLGKHDIYAFATERPDDPIKYGGGPAVTKTVMLGRMGDPRALPVLLETWKAAIPRAEEHEKRRRSMAGWSVWRQHAAEALGALGGPDEIAFLDEQAKATKDRFVANACRNAIKAIEKRLAKQQEAQEAQPAPAKP
jgi:hypothetical protein